MRYSVRIVRIRAIRVCFRGPGVHRPADDRSALARSKGYTLTELMVTLCVAATVASVAGNFRTMLDRVRLNTHTDTLIAHLHFARSEAITRNQRVTLCQTDDGHQCSHGDRWEHGWLIFADPNRNRQVDAGEPILRVQPAARKPYTIRWRGSGGTNYYLSYLPTGPANKFGTFTVCAPNGQGRTVIVNITGRVRRSDRLWTGEAPDCHDS